MKRGVLLGAALGLLGCDDPLLEPQRIDSLRVLAARVEAKDDATRAWPHAGESAQVRVLAVHPSPKAELGFALEVCPAALVARGIPTCAGGVIASGSGSGSSPPQLAFMTPVDTPRLLLRGTVCEGAAPSSDGSCKGHGEAMVFEIEVGDDEHENTNPLLLADALRLDGDSWSAPDPVTTPVAACSESDLSTALLRVSANAAPHRIEAALREQDRDAIAGLDGPTVEVLTLSHYATLGRLERAISVVDPGDSLTPSVRWKAPAAVTSGTVARFYFVLRDLRGGVDFTERRACVLP
ncbi:MAG: hypothetical protein R3B13_26045 [Polyangiaceae bacterium]